MFRRKDIQMAMLASKMGPVQCGGFYAPHLDLNHWLFQQMSGMASIGEITPPQHWTTLNMWDSCTSEQQRELYDDYQLHLKEQDK